jgi:hypothetical protein
VFENRVLRKIFGLQWDEVKGDWRRQYDKQLYDLSTSPFIIRGIKSSRKRWVAHMADRGDA